MPNKTGNLGLRKMAIPIILITLGIPFFRWLSDKKHQPEIEKLRNMGVQQLRQYISTPEQFQLYRDHYLRFDPSSFIKSPARTHKEEKAGCGSESVLAYFCLQDDGYGNRFLFMTTDPHADYLFNKGEAHLVFPYEILVQRFGKTIKMYGCFGDSDQTKYMSIDDMVRSKRYGWYRIAVFDSNSVPNWVETNADLIRGFRSLTPVYQRVK